MPPDFPFSADEFYRRRDDRTNLCPDVVGYDRVSILVTAGADLIVSPGGQLALLGLCNQLARWCRKVSVEIPKAPTLLPTLADPDFSTALVTMMSTVDPFGAFAALMPALPPADIHIHVGTGRVLARAGKFVQASYSGWFAAVSSDGGETLPKPLGDRNDLPGAAAASCLACARAFQLAVAVDPQPIEAITIDLWSLSRARSTSPSLWRGVDSPRVGSILMVGAGSVGSATAYWMRFFNLQGQMDVVDHDIAKIENLNRGLLFTVANLGESKARLVASHFTGSALEVQPFENDWNDYVGVVGRLKMPHDLWLPLANERNVRASMQENFPPAMIHASTSRNWGVNFGRHLPFRDDCILDRFPVEELQPKLRCSTSPVQTAAVEVDAALPFLSAFAGLLVAADIVRSTHVGYPQTSNFGSFDFRIGLVVQAWDRKPDNACGCRQLNRALWTMFNSRTRILATVEQPKTVLTEPAL